MSELRKPVEPPGRLEKGAGDLDRAFADLRQEKTRTEQALASVQAEKQTLVRKVEELDAELGETLVDSARRTTAQRKALEEASERAARLEKEVAALTRREETQRLALEAATRRAEQLEKDMAALRERETKLTGEREASPSEWSERLRQVESLRTERQTLVTLLVGAERARDRAQAEIARLGEAHRVELNEQKQLMEQLKNEVAAAGKREARQAEAWRAVRAELEAKIARLETDAAGARTVLEK